MRGIARGMILDDLVLHAIHSPGLPKDRRMCVMSAQEEGQIPKIQHPGLQIDRAQSNRAK